MRRLFVAATLVLFLAGFAWSVCKKEGQIKNGETLIVHLLPRDPRAFLLGDYMALNYAMNREVDTALSARYADGKNLPGNGIAVVRLDPDKVASFVRLDDGSPLQDDERRLHFRVRGHKARIAAPAFYFQEGSAEDFDRAQYGELRVDADGASLLVHLLDDELARIQPQKVKTE